MEKVRSKFQTVLGVWYTLQTYINIHPRFLPVPYLVYTNNGKERRLAKIFLGANDVRQHSPGGPRFFSFWGRIGVLDFGCSQFVPMKFSLCFHEICKFQYLPQVSNVFPNLFPIALTLCHILCP